MGLYKRLTECLLPSKPPLEWGGGGVNLFALRGRSSGQVFVFDQREWGSPVCVFGAEGEQ